MWYFLTGCQIDNTDFLIIERIGEQQYVKVTFDISVNATLRQVDVAKRLQIDGYYPRFIITSVPNSIVTSLKSSRGEGIVPLPGE